MPKRIQLRRAKGWKKPAGAVVVARPTKWGNPFKAATYGDSQSTRAKHLAGLRAATGAAGGHPPRAPRQGPGVLVPARRALPRRRFARTGKSGLTLSPRKGRAA
jgi:hypothetical protein